MFINDECQHKDRMFENIVLSRTSKYKRYIKMLISKQKFYKNSKLYSAQCTVRSEASSQKKWSFPCFLFKFKRVVPGAR